MKVLELFSGTHSVGKVCEELGYEVISVDITDYKGKYPPTHKCNILDFNYKQYPIGYFDIIWGSPPCVNYSKLQDCWLNRTRKGIFFTKEVMEQNMIESDALVQKTFEIIDYFKPHKWYIENPQNGRLKNRVIMKDIPYYDVDYCMYCDWGYRKRTRIWTNIKHFKPKKCNKNCGNMVEVDGRKLHKNNLGSNIRNRLTNGNCGNTLTRYRIPTNLIKELFVSS